jgi:hypothetical protein
MQKWSLMGAALGGGWRCCSAMSTFPVFVSAIGFPLEPFGKGNEDIWLMEEIDTGALHG